MSLLVPARAHAQSPAATPSPADDAPSPAIEAQRRSAARTLYSARRYREAAQAYEALWRDTTAAKYRFNAGMAREAAEHYGAALLHWRAYLASASASAAERRMLEQRIAATSAQLRPVHIHVEGAPPGPLSLSLHAPEPAPQGPRDPIELAAQTDLDLLLEPGAWIVTLQLAERPPIVARFDLSAELASPTITLTVPSPPAPDPRPSDPPPTPAPLSLPLDLTLTIAPQRALARGVELQWSSPVPGTHLLPPGAESPFTLRLPAGAYTLRARAPGFTPQTLDIQLDAPHQLDLLLRREPAERARLGLGYGLGGAGLVLGAVGVGFIARGARELADLRRAGTLEDCSTTARCARPLNAALDVSSGLALLGSGIGAGIVAATAGVGAQDRALKIEAGVGAATFISGLIWYVAEIQRPYDIQHRARDHAAATMLGGGAGLLGAATISLLTRRLVGDSRAHALSPAVSLNSVGLTWNARF